MTVLKEVALIPLPVGTSLDMIRVTMFWWDMPGGGYGKIIKMIEYNKILG